MIINLLPSLLLSAAAVLAAEPLQLNVVPTPIKSYRLLAMSMDDDGYIWCGSIHRVVHRYDPRTGTVKTLEMPADSSASSCICAGKKVYILGQNYPKLIVYDRGTAKFSEFSYPSAKPDVWYGTPLIADRFIYLFDRGATGLIQWDTQTDTCKPIAYPYETVLPSAGHFEPGDQAIWCKLWDYSTGQYVPQGVARFDVATAQFTGIWPFPKDDAALAEFTDPAHTFFLPWTLRGKLVPFDFNAQRWCRFIDVPRFRELFGFIGGSTRFHGKDYFSLSTYDGDQTGVDGKPYHFCNVILEFDPATRRFDFPTLISPNAYYQVSYSMATADAFFATGSNIMETDGSLNQARPGECVFWQSVPIQK